MTCERGHLRLLWLTGVICALAGAVYPQAAPLALIPGTLPDGLVGQSYFASVSNDRRRPANFVLDFIRVVSHRANDSGRRRSKQFRQYHGYADGDRDL